MITKVWPKLRLYLYALMATKLKHKVYSFLVTFPELSYYPKTQEMFAAAYPVGQQLPSQRFVDEATAFLETQNTPQVVEASRNIAPDQISALTRLTSALASNDILALRQLRIEPTTLDSFSELLYKNLRDFLGLYPKPAYLHMIQMVPILAGRLEVRDAFANRYPDEEFGLPVLQPTL